MCFISDIQETDRSSEKIWANAQMIMLHQNSFSIKIHCFSVMNISYEYNIDWLHTTYAKVTWHMVSVYIVTILGYKISACIVSLFFFTDNSASGWLLNTLSVDSNISYSTDEIKIDRTASSDERHMPSLNSYDNTNYSCGIVDDNPSESQSYLDNSS